MNSINFHETCMLEALRQAEIAFNRDEVPVGAVIVHERKIIARAYNQVEMLKDPTAHAEMLAITQATNYLETKWLNECMIYVTLEPCSMCSGALILSRVKKVIFGTFDPKTGACGSVLNILQHNKLNHTVEIESEILMEQCSGIISKFFKQKRHEKLINEN